METISILTYLLISSMTDIKDREVSVFTTIICALVGIILKIVIPEQEVVNLLNEILLGMIPGLIAALISKITCNGVGMGDAAVLGVLGIYDGIYRCTLILFVSLFISALFSMLLLILKKINLKQTIPFVPFILVGYIVVSLMV